MENQIFLKITNCRVTPFVKVILFIQLIIIGLVALNFYNINIPIFQEILFTVYLMFIPGILILRILRIHNLSNINTMFYSIGISLFFIMFSGLILNYFAPYIGIKNPISHSIITLLNSTLTIILLIINYIFDRNYKPVWNKTAHLKFSKNYFLIFLPFLAIFGTYLMNNYQENFLLIIMILIISILPILVAFDKINKKYYPLMILTITTSLILHTTLISNHIWGYDIHNEYYVAKTVISNGLWDYNFNTILNSMLSITMLGPIYSIFSGVNLNWTYKLVYPLIFSLVPLVLYQIYQKFTTKKIAFLSSFFFMSFFIFFGEMLQLARQEIAEFIFVLIILLMFEKIENIKKSFLYVIFAITLIVSHYSLSYIFTGMIIFTLIFIYLYENEKKYIKSVNLQKYIKCINFKKYVQFKYDSKSLPGFISINYILLILVFLLAWYLFTAGSTPLNALTRMAGNVYGNIVSELFNSSSVQGLSVVTKQEVSVAYYILKFLNLIFSFFVFVGVLSILKVKISSFNKFKEKIYEIDIINIKLNPEYIGFVLIAVILCIACVSIPYFALSLDVTRLYHITLLILSPFCIFGAIIIFNLIFNHNRMPKILQEKKNYLKITSILISIFFIFNSGLVFEIFQDNPSSIALSSNKDYPQFSEKELSGALWAYNHTNSDKIYADSYGRFLLQEYGFKPIVIEGTTKTSLGKNLVYLRAFNVVDNQLYYAKSNNPILFNDSKVYAEIKKKNRVYSNGGCDIYA
jgi:uncharacterized membrane protein